MRTSARVEVPIRVIDISGRDHDARPVWRDTVTSDGRDADRVREDLRRMAG